MPRRCSALIALFLGTGLCVSHANSSDFITRITADAQEVWNAPSTQVIFSRVEIGLRSSHFGLRDDSERHYDAQGEIIEGYLGSITELEPQQDYFPSMYANVRFSEWLALQVGFERFELRTGRFWDDDTDGSFEFNGPSLTAQVRYPNTTRFTPYAGAGLALLDVDFAMIGWWHNGFGGADAHENYRAWRASGSPRWPNGGYQRNLKVEDDFAIKPVFQVGCLCRLTEHFSLDLDWRYMSLDSELEYTLSRYGDVFDDRGTSSFPMEAWIIDFGVLANF
jgi:outer membrane protein W